MHTGTHAKMETEPNEMVVVDAPVDINQKAAIHAPERVTIKGMDFRQMGCRARCARSAPHLSGLIYFNCVAANTFYSGWRK
jgi:hypothetical protein